MYDPGFLKRLEASDGWVAILAIPTSPYFAIAPVAKWALVKRDGQDVVEGLIPALGSSNLVSLATMPFEGEFITYAYIPLQASPLLQREGRSSLDLLIQLAEGRGMQLAQMQAEEQYAHLRLLSPTEEHDEEGADEPVPHDHTS